ncbi:MAG: alpha/beta fold hydrolase [Candidatus Delongbacteria bacterium]|nr:alpha/beta fold hydrolase [Candidatus Delongbacteria bacterium]MBN2834849.1 alpha/beta fold hydrolase [Candidatus Delongbacteria bacterium]
MTNLRTVNIGSFVSEKGIKFDNFKVTYRIFNDNLDLNRPVILVNHALTGNSLAGGETGWWKDIIGNGKGVDTSIYNVICFDIPGNGHGGDEFLFEDYDRFSTRDVAIIFKSALYKLGIIKLKAIVGGSIGGMIGWEISLTFPNFVENLIAVGSCLKTSDFVYGHCQVQDSIFNNAVDEKQNLALCRSLAMLFYRGHESFDQKFNYAETNGERSVKSYLDYQGKKLARRFSPKAYRVVNHLLKTHDSTRGRENYLEAIKNSGSKISIVGISTDILFPLEENYSIYRTLKNYGIEANFDKIDSHHGHDGFFVETEQLNQIIKKSLGEKAVTKRRHFIV